MYTLVYNLKPYWGENTIAHMDVSGQIEADALGDSGPGLDYCSVAFGGIVTFAVYDQLQIEDNLGPIPYELRAAPSDNTGVEHQGFYFTRPATGLIKWRYRIYPRILPDGYRSSPYYDFRAEPFGLNGAGLFAFILPTCTQQLSVNFSWDLSQMPSEARGIWSYGEGNVCRSLTAWDMRFSLFNVGLMNAYEEGSFGFYWFTEPEFEIKPIAEQLSKIFKYMKNYFNDPDSGFRVFLRRDPFEESGGGSACPYAFIAGYSAITGLKDPDHWLNVLVHETTHTWPVMDDRTTGTGTWFCEGGTEYYCTMLPYRGGFVDSAFTVARLNEKINERYYQNVYRHVPNMELPAIQWQDRRAQKVPYGRGFIYLANVEAKLRKIGRSIDEIVLKHGWGNPMTADDWKGFIRETLGEPGIEDFESMAAGKLITPEPDVFGPEFVTIEEQIELEGETVLSYRWALRDHE